MNHEYCTFIWNHLQFLCASSGICAVGGEAGVGWHGNLIASSPLFMGITVKLAAGQLDKRREENSIKFLVYMEGPLLAS